MVPTVKHLFTKARESGQDPHLAMLCLRTTPIDHHTPSPCKILNGRRYRSNLPIVGTKETSVADYTDNLQRDLYKRHHDRGAKYVGKRIATYCTPHTLTIYLFIIFLSNFITQTIFIHQISYIITLTIFNHKITSPLSHTYF